VAGFDPSLEGPIAVEHASKGYSTAGSQSGPYERRGATTGLVQMLTDTARDVPVLRPADVVPRVRERRIDVKNVNHPKSLHLSPTFRSIGITKLRAPSSMRKLDPNPLAGITTGSAQVSSIKVQTRSTCRSGASKIAASWT
jgi:hypothetical protein